MSSVTILLLVSQLWIHPIEGEHGPPAVSARVPIMEIDADHDLGDFATPLDITHTITVGNSGSSPLVIEAIRPS